MSELTGRSPQNAVLRFRDEKVEPSVRSAAERALATLVSHSTAANARRRATEAELTKLTDAIEAPLAKLIRNDPESVRAIEALRKRHLVEPEQTSKLTRNAVRIRLVRRFDKHPGITGRDDNLKPAAAVLRLGVVVVART